MDRTRTNEGATLRAWRERQWPRMTRLRLARRLRIDPSTLYKLETGGIQRVSDALRQRITKAVPELAEILGWPSNDTEHVRRHPSTGTDGHEEH